MGQHHQHINYTMRLKIEWMKLHKFKVKEIAEEIGIHISNVYRELKRGEYEHLNSDYTTEKRYSADLAEANHQMAMTAKGAPMKIGNNHKVAQFIEGLILNEHYSPAAVCAVLKSERGEKYGITFCRNTIYKYIEDGNIFPNITNADLPEKGKRKRTYKKIRAKRAPRGKSIETRPKEVESRETIGHWEMDTVVSGKGSKARLLVLSERASRKEIIIKMPDGTTQNVVLALDWLERRYGAEFNKVFQSITVDNGSEFADVEGMERSYKKNGEQRTTIYYCHPYTACERGTNENSNKMIRRIFPKGTDFGKISEREIKKAETWLNNYPREILGFKSANVVFDEWRCSNI